MTRNIQLRKRYAGMDYSLEAKVEAREGVMIVTIVTEKIMFVVPSGETNPFTELLLQCVPGGSENLNGVPVLVVLREVQYLNSAGLGCLITFHKKMKGRGRYAFCDIHPHVMEPITVTKLNELFVMRGTEVNALEDRSWQE